jgi:hypothetical protein
MRACRVRALRRSSRVVPDALPVVAGCSITALSAVRTTIAAPRLDAPDLDVYRVWSPFDLWDTSLDVTLHQN